MSRVTRIAVCLALITFCVQIQHGFTEKQQHSLLDGDSADDYQKPRKEVLEKSYHGLIRENETFVEITPLIKVDERKVCMFRILKKQHHEIPFQIELVKNLGILKARRTLNCEKRRSYRFEIEAIFCDGSYSLPAKVHISVIDINEYAPTFLQPSYVTEVDEGRLYQEIVRVEATDKDCTPLFGDVCKYELLNNDQPFTIDNDGSIKNTEPLSHKLSHNHILSVVAYDCAMKQSAPVMVNIKVKRVCEAKLTGVPERIDYTANSMESPSLFPNLHLDLCDIHYSHDEMTIRSSVILKTKHISFGCDRDVTECFRGHALVDLLQKGTEWTKDLSYDEGLEPVFHFDGTLGAIIPEAVMPHHDFASHPFSIVTMFRHLNSSSTNKHAKEHIICSADDHKMNRHHMALFVRNCRLILLLRKNFNEGDLNIFSPAEWRWKIPQVCDNEWHHYVLNIDLPKVELHIDGVKFESQAEDHHTNPEVIDDWPLHAAHGVNTTLTIGSCYQGSENRLKHGFNGDISEIKLSLNKLLTTEDIKCSTNCAENLIPPPEKYFESDELVQFNTQLNEIYIEGTNRTSIELLLQKIQYINLKPNPTIGRRNIEIRTTLAFASHSPIRLPTVETYIMVNVPSVSMEVAHSTVSASPMKLDDQQQQKLLGDTKNSLKGSLEDIEKPRIEIIGNVNHLVSYPDIKDGVRILANISIVVYSGSEAPKKLQTLDSCTVSVFPSLNPDHEEILLDGDESLSSTLDIKTNINKEGVEMIGYDTTENYLDVLKSLVYTNKKPAYYLNRVFKLMCSQANAQFKSSEYTLTLTVLHPKQTITTTSIPATYQQHHEQIGGVVAHAMVHTHDVQEPKSRVHNIVHKAQNSHPTMLIIVICVFFVILLCGVSVARLRNNNHKYMERHQPCPKITTEQLDWDDSALTITINPMQNDVVSEESSDSENSDSDDDELINGKYKNVSQLEWDNSTM
ncbi:unnamed protein product [Hermetia illucens]|uniref:Cadherin domain-containing protein n=1 Tax=Hermetia illucens TaxID=343691 RepID=A0A7R8V8K6_HERIL|nr:calsyntenin-1 [Hermetia illucens]CAD7094141.1 unnamed protein product [Hermetia illucens]